MTIPAITLTQPWATLVAIKAKRIETRSWRTPYTGPLAIHAAKGFPGWAKSLMFEEPFCSVLAAAGITSVRQLPTGVVVATCRLVRCVPTDSLRFPVSTPHERAFGDYSPDRWAWMLEDITPLPEPVPAKGALGLWRWDGGGR